MGLILAIDIGGTNSRFAAFQVRSESSLVMKEKVWIPSTDAESFEHLLELVQESDFPYLPQDFDMAVIALAGPVVGGNYCHPTNLKWAVDISKGPSVYGFKKASLINDFVAQAYACRTPAVAECKVLQQGTFSPQGTVGVLGAGTGFGHCALVPVPSVGFVPVPSEAGHITFPFETSEELDFCAFVKDRVGISYCYGDEVLTGKGLNHLHLYLTGEDLKPYEVAKKMADGGLTLDWYRKFTARCCRNYALSVLATGGLYISGGILAKNPFVVEHPDFMEEFRRSSSMVEVLSRIPVFLNDNQNSGLYGSALFGALAM
ncbi:glucokinase [Maridesulfovibrio ferrireducens]|uniref:Glucokinase n=1 Tax=Maridesulfovibrio ferrireducens TaxID=246191 RepID=A0A1G9HGS6_9BACT|nr:glucokinase [Maridesulfovibrio ferrireducens]SDL11996.1 glucokinase [Maridesulfovibrio ferrireducens]